MYNLFGIMNNMLWIYPWPRPQHTSPLITPDSLQLRRSSWRLQNTSGTWSRRSVIVNHPMGNVIEPTLATKLLPGFFRLFTFLSFRLFSVFPFPQPLVSLSGLVPVPTAPRLPAAVYPNAPTSTAPPDFHRPRSSSRSLRRFITPANPLRVPRFHVQLPSLSRTFDRASLSYLFAPVNH